MDAHREEETGNNLVNNNSVNGNPPPALPQNHRNSSTVDHRRVEFVIAPGQDIRNEIFNFMDSNPGQFTYVFEYNVHVSSVSMLDEIVNGAVYLEGYFTIDFLVGTSNTRVSNDGTRHRSRVLNLMFSHPTRGLLMGVAIGPLIAASPLHAVLHICNESLDDFHERWRRQRLPRIDSGTATRFEGEENGLANGHIPNHAGPSEVGSNHAGSNGNLPNHAGSNGHLPNGHIPYHVGQSQSGSIHASSNGHVRNHAGPSRARSNHAGSNLDGPNDDESNNVGTNPAGANRP